MPAHPPPHLDFDVETYSTADLRACGSYAYARHPTTTVLCAWWRDSETGEFGEWLEGQPPPSALFAAIASGRKVFAHNCQFDAEIWRFVLSRRHGWVWVGYDAFVDTQAVAQIYNLPGKLDHCARFVSGVGKSGAGHALMLKMCKPARAIKSSADPRRLHTQENLRALSGYCRQDVVAEHALISQIPYFPPHEEAVWRATWRMNRRGAKIDRPFAQTLRAIADEVQAHYRTVLADTTGGAIAAETQRAALGDWLVAHGAKMPVTETGRPSFNRQQEHLVDLSQATPAAAQAYDLYQQLSNSSLSKLAKMLTVARPEDDRIRGAFRYAGAGMTGRWASQEVQLQNIYRGIFEGEAAYAACHQAIVEGASWQELELLYGGNALDVLSTMLRPCFVADPGAEYLVADYSAIEGRVLAWMAGEDEVIAAYRAGKRMYAVDAAAIFNCTYEQVVAEKAAGDSSKDKIGKVANLACVAEGTLVATPQGWATIQTITEVDYVCDGERWVRCDGAVDNGVRRVIRYGGLTATPDHLVFTEEEEAPVPFVFAAACGARIVHGERWRDARVPTGDLRGGPLHRPKLAKSLCAGRVLAVRARSVDGPQRVAKEPTGQVPLLPDTYLPDVAGSKDDRSEAPVREPERFGVSKLWRARDNVRFPKHISGVRVHHEAPRSGSREGHRPHRQRQGVRARQSSVGYAKGKLGEQKVLRRPSGRFGVGGDRLSVCGPHDFSPAEIRAITRRYCAQGASRRARQAQRVANHRGQAAFARVYDVVNAGPRHRYLTAGGLVHNCGFGGSVGAFDRFGGRKLGVTAKRAKEIVDAWRDARFRTVCFWRRLQDAAMTALDRPNVTIDAGPIAYRYNGNDLMARLPSGRKLYYHKARITERAWPDGGTSPQITYYGVDLGRVGWLNTYGGKLCENVVQACARDLLADAFLRVEAAGFHPVMTVHDELVCEEPQGRMTHRQLCDVMAIAPSWAAGLPVKAEGYTSLRYRKG